MSKKTRLFVLLGLVALPFAALATGCQSECVDDCDCQREFGLNDAGTNDFYCSNDNSCVKGNPPTSDGGTTTPGTCDRTAGQ